MSGTNSCGNNKPVTTNAGNSFIFIIVLYILLAIILGSFIL